jgi:hypothetical protein
MEPRMTSACMFTPFDLALPRLLPLLGLDHGLAVNLRLVPAEIHFGRPCVGARSMAVPAKLIVTERFLAHTFLDRQKLGWIRDDTSDALQAAEDVTSRVYLCTCCIGISQSERWAPLSAAVHAHRSSDFLHRRSLSSSASRAWEKSLAASSLLNTCDLNGFSSSVSEASLQHGVLRKDMTFP